MDNLSIGFATLADVDALVALHYRCFTEKDHIALQFGKRFIRSAYRWFVTSPRTFVVVAKEGDRILGFQSVSEGPYNAPMLINGWKALVGILQRPRLVFNSELIRRLFSLINPKKQKLLDGHKVGHLAFIGVDPNARGMGVGKMLIYAAIEACRAKGMSAIITGVKKDNLKSSRMLESAGMVEVPELETRRFVYLKKDLLKEEQYPVQDMAEAL
jgi:ribosomal protein S18 acetylase RimI-like enzyme